MNDTGKAHGFESRARKTSIILALLILGLSTAALAQQSQMWDSWQWLIGKWTGEGTGAPGEGKGYFSFAPDLDGKILVRHNHSEYPASGGRPASSHDDLLIVYPGAPAQSARAIYFDNEGHVINYEVSFSQDGRSIVFLSPESPAPRFRLTYMRGKDDRITIRFEISPSGKIDDFKTYLEGGAKRQS